METAKFAMVEELASLVKDNLFCKHLILSTEEAFVDFLQNDRRTDNVLELKPMNPYQRMLIHRLADIFGLAHESVGEGDDRRLVLMRCTESFIPSILVNDSLEQFGGPEPAPTTHILKREATLDLKKESFLPKMTMKEREAAYQAARERIFSMHPDDKKEPAEAKPRNVPVVARRMIAHALGKNILSGASEKEGSLNSMPDTRTGKTTNVSTKDMQRHKEKLPTSKHGLSGVFSHDMKESNRVLPSGSSEGFINPQPQNLERQQIGAAKRMFANALGRPSSKQNPGSQKQPGK